MGAPTPRETRRPGPGEGVGGGVNPSPKGKKGVGRGISLNHSRPKGLVGLLRKGPESPQGAFKRPPRDPYEVSKRPQRGFQETPKNPTSLKILSGEVCLADLTVSLPMGLRSFRIVQTWLKRAPRETQRVPRRPRECSRASQDCPRDPIVPASMQCNGVFAQLVYHIVRRMCAAPYRMRSIVPQTVNDLYAAMYPYTVPRSSATYTRQWHHEPRAGTYIACART